MKRAAIIPSTWRRRIRVARLSIRGITGTGLEDDRVVRICWSNAGTATGRTDRLIFDAIKNAFVIILDRILPGLRVLELHLDVMRNLRDLKRGVRLSLLFVKEMGSFRYAKPRNSKENYNDE